MGATRIWTDEELMRLPDDRADGTTLEIDASGALDGEEVLPGFECPLAEVLS